MDFYNYVLSRARKMQERQSDLREKINNEYDSQKLISLCVQKESVDYAITMIWFMLEHEDYIGLEVE